MQTVRSAPAANTRLRRAGPAAAVVALVLAACLRAGAPAEAAAAPLTRTPDGRPLEMAFNDDFDSFRRWSGGKGVWRTTFRDGRGDEFEERTLKWNKEAQLYVDAAWAPDGGPPLRIDPFSVRDGTLEIVARPADPEVAKRLRGYKYVSGVITTQPSFSQTYGYFEMRAKLPRGKGVWPAFWLLPTDFSWPPEIDIMESIGDPGVVYTTLHSNAVKATGTETRITPGEFHTFAVSWDRDQVIWFIDGREVKRMPTPADMHKPMYMLANVALGGDWAGQPDHTTPFPARMNIDYIRAYRFAR